MVEIIKNDNAAKKGFMAVRFIDFKRT